MTLTMAKSGPNRLTIKKILNRGKMTWNVELSEGAFDPLAMKLGDGKG
jgi:hypothetical protein